MARAESRRLSNLIALTLPYEAKSKMANRKTAARSARSGSAWGVCGAEGYEFGGGGEVAGAEFGGVRKSRISIRI